MGELAVVGCGTVVPEADRGGSAYHVALGGSRILLDCGPAAVQSLVRQGLPWSELTDLVITHFHSDHVGGLPGLFFALRHGVLPPREETPLDVWGPPGTERLFERLATALGTFLLDPGFPVRIHDLPPGGARELAGGVALSSCKTPHTDESQAVRLDAPDGSLGYTGDTGRSEALGPFLAGVDALVCECSLPEEQVGENHLSPSGVAELARAARPGVLVLTHVYPHFRESGDVVALVRAAGYAGGEVLLARDGLRVTLG